MGTIADILGFGQSNGPHFKLDYSTATGAGITTLTQAQLATSNGVANILGLTDDGAAVVLRSDVDVDPIATNGYPRTEWREMNTDGTTNRAFNPMTGDHSLEVLVRTIHLPPVKPTYVMLQLHDAVQDLIEITVQRRSDYETTGKLEVALKLAVGGSSSSSGLPRFISDFGTLGELTTNLRWLQASIRTGAIAPGGAAGWSCTVNGVSINSWDPDIPTWDGINGNNSYFKTGMYLQTKWTGSAGGNGLETDRDEYGEAAWRYIKVRHNGEAAPWVPTWGTDNPGQVTGVTWGAKAHGHQTVSNAGITLTPDLPAGLVDGDMMFCIVRASRGVVSTSTTYTSGAPYTSMPSSPSITGWDRILSMRDVQTTGAYPGGPQLAAHNVRFQMWAKRWVSGDSAPSVVYTPGTTLTDTMSAQVFKCSSAKLSTELAELIDQLPAGIDVPNASSNSNETGLVFAAATSTTALGPTAATPGTPKPGSLAIAAVTHECNGTNTTVGVVTGGTDSLSWAEGGQHSVTTVTPAAGSSSASSDEPAWANDWAIVPLTGYNQVIPAKTAAATLSGDANKPNNSVSGAGKGWGVAFTIAPANRRSSLLSAV